MEDDIASDIFSSGISEVSVTTSSLIKPQHLIYIHVPVHNPRQPKTTDRLRTMFSVIATDSARVWRNDIDIEFIKSAVSISKFASPREYINSIVTGFHDKNVSVTPCDNVFIVNLSGDKPISFDLEPVNSAVESCRLIKQTLFYQAELLYKLQKDLAEVKAKLDRSSGTSSKKSERPRDDGFDMVPSKRSKRIVVSPKKGMSVINPSRRRIQGGKGVVWDND